MILNIGVPIEEKLLEDAVITAVKAHFAPPVYNRNDGRGADGFENLRAQVRDHTRNIDFTPVIKTAIAAMLPDLLAELVSDELRRLIKAEIKRQRQTGELTAEILPLLAEIENQ